MGVVLIAAMGLNRVIGRGDGLPWHQPDDLRHFQRLTLHHPVVMGRKTFETFPGTLPGRLNIVVTRQRSYRSAGAEVVYSVGEALEMSARKQPGRDVYVAGGGELYTEVLPRADRIELTVVHCIAQGEVRFPELPAGDFEVAGFAYQAADDRNPLAMTYLSLVRRSEKM